MAGLRRTRHQSPCPSRVPSPQSPATRKIERKKERVDPISRTPCVDGKRLWHSLILSCPVSEVLDDDDLLIEILVRVGFPTTLVHAALVCRRWFHHASDPVFLHRFRKLHPPRLLGFYHTPNALLNPTPFVPMVPQPPELAAVVQRVARYRFGIHDVMRVKNCQNGSIFTIMYNAAGAHISVIVHSPLCPGREMAFIPLPPFQAGNLFALENQVLSREDDEGCLSHFYVFMKFDRVTTIFTVHVYKLQDGAWCKHTSVTTKLTRHPRWELKAVLVDNKIYVVADPRDIIVLDLMNSGFSTIQLPQGVEHGSSDIVLSRVNDASGVYLIDTKELQLNIWLHRGATGWCWIPFL
ncbi:hypothetical protein QYE76_020131 [Lolium multiflorum]|uniref:F-box domain-containing protein n=1 Tax=Lolium multiflorum TaxID=4521 RepID=A0AAD8VPQ5_LOLMU|nr:hypothetical protein QYE76_020131 [Lolium multiflorum]